MLYINCNRSIDTIASLNIRLLWGDKNNCGLDLISVASIFTTQYRTAIQMGYIKSVDLKHIYNPEEEMVLK